MVERLKKHQDPLNSLLLVWNQDTYDSATWTREAYTKIFEKFTYAKPSDFMSSDLHDFATDVLLTEYAYMQNTVVLPPTATEKNTESTPGFPKFTVYETEAEYLQAAGWSEYVEIYNADIPLTQRVCWWTFLKQETLKKEKIANNDIRMIMCTDPVYTRLGACFEQHQNQRMKEHTETHQAQVGWTPFFGGIHQRLSRLEKKKGRSRSQFVELDWTRFDGTIPTELLYHIKQIRFFFLASRYRTPHLKKLHEWYVSNLLDKIVLLPTGEVTRIIGGNPSGQISTTTDNNMVNTYLTAYEIAYLFKRVSGRCPTVDEYYANVDSICYGDDRLLAVNPDWLEYDTSVIPSFYKEVFGMWVKPQNLKKQETLTGLSFCGFTFVKREGVYYGVPNVDKILSTFENPNKLLPDLSALWGKLISLRILCEYADEKVKTYLDEQIYRIRVFASAENIELPEVPDDFYHRVWTGGPKNAERWRNQNPKESVKAASSSAPWSALPQRQRREQQRNLKHSNSVGPVGRGGPPESKE
ncbi:RdRp [Passerine astrovirus 1]|nr:RdRp [Passerine astrovirus 1]